MGCQTLSIKLFSSPEKILVQYKTLTLVFKINNNPGRDALVKIWAFSNKMYYKGIRHKTRKAGRGGFGQDILGMSNGLGLWPHRFTATQQMGLTKTNKKI